MPAEVRFGAQHAFGVCPDLDLALGDEVAQALDATLRRVGLRQAGDALGEALDGLRADLVPRAAPNGAIAVEPRAEGLGLLQAARDLFEHGAVCAADEYSCFFELGDLLGDRVEAGDEEVADGDIGRFGVAQHLLESVEEGGIGLGVQDVHGWFVRSP